MVDDKSWRPYAKMYKHGPYTVQDANAPAVKGETKPYRRVPQKNGLITTPHPDISTLYDILRYGAKQYGNAKAMGYRKLIKQHDEVKKVKKTVDGKETMVDKKWTYFELSGYHYFSYVEFERMALEIGQGLRGLGMKAEDRLHIFAATSPFWMAMANGAGTQSMPIVTAYDTLGEEGLRHSMKQTQAKAVFCDPHLLPNLVKPLSDSAIQHVIYNSQGEVKQDHIDELKKAYPNLTVQSFDELRELGRKTAVDPVPPKASDLCCIMFTSGSTGPPKGVLIKHSNVVASVAGIDAIMGKYLGPGDSLIAFLPLAHIFEYCVEMACIYWGVLLASGNPKTLSEASVKNCKGDIREARPTIMIGVPAIWETIKKGIMAKVNAGNVVTRNMFWSAMAAKGMLLSTGIPGTSVLESVVFSKVKEATGGRLRVCLNGAGPIAKDTQRFISYAICPMLGGYGLTETCAMGAIMDPATWCDDALGETPGSIEIKLVDFPDAGYYATNNPPQGEIWIRGAPVTEGYLDLPEENKQAFEDGWFKTGDIGEFDKIGHLRIIDRKKNLVKTQNGEYIALEKLESIYRTSPIVANICVYASPEKAKPVAIIVPVEAALQKLAKENGIEGHGIEDLAANKKLRGPVLKELQSAGKAGGLGGIEIIEGVAIDNEEWTPQNGLITSAQKLQRKAILERNKKGVDEAYGGSS